MSEDRSASVDVEIGPGSGRLDVALTQALAAAGHALSRMRVRALIEEGHVRRLASSAALSPARPAKAGDRFRITLPAPAPAVPPAQSIPLSVLYEDEDLIVIDKPAGLVVHPAPGNPDLTLVNALIAHCGASLSGIGGIARPGIVHRLDKDTSGVMVAAKTDLAHQSLAAQFAAHGRDGRLHRIYHAVVWGVPAPARGRIEGAIGRSPANRKAFAVVPSGGKPAVTHYEVQRRFGATASLLACRLETGRTHQIRVHLAHLGHPVLGDPVYGRGRRGTRPAAASAAARTLGRQALHAAALGFEHPRTGQALRFTAPLPSDLCVLVQELEEL